MADLTINQRKYAYEYGKRWSVFTPRFAIGRKIDSLSVSASDAEIESLIRDAIAKTQDARYTPTIINQCIAYAMERHKRNQKLYLHVTRGY